MPETAVTQIDRAMEALQKLSESTKATPADVPGRAPRARFRMRRGLVGGATAAAAAILPFFVLVRLSVWLYEVHLLSAWLAVGLGVAATTGLLTGYAFVLSRVLRRRWHLSAWVLKGLLLIVLAYSAYALLYVSAAHVKQPALRSTYTALHPLLRLSISTLVLVDRDLVITDGQRQPEDYRRIGLPVRARSLHYRQADGYVHAVDLRTRGRSAWQNSLMAAYFRLMGFDTLRHVGTADHLHVSLGPPRLR